MIDNKTHIVFDLDDTLYKEIDFVKSAYHFINLYIKDKYQLDFESDIEYCLINKISFFDNIKKKFSDNHFTITKYLDLYRFHYPNIKLSKDVSDFLAEIRRLKLDFSIITDGRSISQKNKIDSLNLTDEVKSVIISEETGYEKPHIHNFKIIQELYPNKNFVYIADNPSKDFLAPNFLKWGTICLLDNGKNIHKQIFNLEKKYLPKRKIKLFKELIK